MTLEQLRIFIAVAEREHVTRAAEALCLTQSAVSHAIMTLEQEFGLSFFDRIGRGIALTPTGRVFLSEARAVLSRAEAARSRMTELTMLKGGTLHLWASQTIASYWLPARLNQFHTRNPDITLSLTISNTEEICQNLASGTLSLGLIEGAGTEAGLSLTEIARDQLVLVVAPDHPWSREPPLPRDLTQAGWILRERGSGTRASFENALSDWGVDPAQLTIVMELTSNEAIANAISTGQAATVLSASVVAGLIENGLLHHVEMAFPDRRFALVRNDRSLSPAEQAFTQFLRSSL
ncbi:LysR family transcriptional regulator [Asaia sp. W19]|uniref:LysR family transcriptional regulator n=1 Tax=unclassified Asaia TaxID=2685023 RepID=UPI000F8E2263|nr:LysR family transcriptional regulator [Asaia sp. W19]RUT27060.1 LysR family transcriptional regulator [Asaia sp. W19]